MKLRYILGTLLITATLPLAAQAEQVSHREMVDVQLVDFSGKPPFKRRTVSVPVSDVAQLETLGQEAIEYVEVKEVVMRGKPPYRRKITMMPVYDVAQFEVLEAQNTSQKRGTRSPFKRF